MSERQNQIFQGKLQRKVFRLCISLVIIAVIAFALVGILEMRALQRITGETGKAQ